MRHLQIEFTVAVLLVVAPACSSNNGPGQGDGGNQGMSTGHFTLAVDDAKLERSIVSNKPKAGNVFVDVGVTLTNISETEPLPDQFVLYSLLSGSSLVYMASVYTSALTNACPTSISVAAGGHLSCRIAFEAPLTERPATIQYADSVGKRMATAPIASLLPLAAPTCMDWTQAGTGNCQSCMGSSVMQPSGACRPQVDKVIQTCGTGSCCNGEYPTGQGFSLCFACTASSCSTAADCVAANTAVNDCLQAQCGSFCL